MHNLCSTALRLAGLNGRSVAAIADTVRDAERDGCKSHGLFRLKGFCDGIRSGKCDPVALPIIIKDAPGAVTVDAQRGFSSLAFRVRPAFANRVRRPIAAVRRFVPPMCAGISGWISASCQ